MLLKETLREVAKSQNTDLSLYEYGTKREKLTEIEINLPFAIVISGIRRCGKSTILRQLMKTAGTVYYLNFDDPRLSSFTVEDFQLLEKALLEEFGDKKYYFLDEIQVVAGWEAFARYLLDKKKRVVLTGSNASLLSRDLGTKLTGRHLSYELFPFSYREFLKAGGQKANAGSLADYLQNGGFPEYLKHKKAEILQHLLNDIISRDIAVKHGIRSIKTLKEMALYMLSNTGKEFTYNALKKTFGLGSTSSAISFISFFEDAYLLFTIPKFDYSPKKQLVNPKKAYAIDTGLARINTVSLSEDKGRLLETAVFLHLRRKYKDIYYFKETGECDFVIKEANKITSAVQVSLEITGQNREREINGLIEALETFDLPTGMIITYDQEDEIREQGKRILLIPAWKFLNRDSK